MKPGIRIIQVSAGENHCLAVSDDGRLFAWGDNYEAQCGNGYPEKIDRPRWVLS